MPQDLLNNVLVLYHADDFHRSRTSRATKRGRLIKILSGDRHAQFEVFSTNNLLDRGLMVGWILADEMTKSPLCQEKLAL